MGGSWGPRLTRAPGQPNSGESSLSRSSVATDDQACRPPAILDAGWFGEIGAGQGGRISRGGQIHEFALPDLPALPAGAAPARLVDHGPLQLT
jgi:hypothetical protein